MSAVLQWAFSLCGAMVAMGLCRMLLPGSSMEKMFRLIVSVFFLCCLLSPVVIGHPALMADIPLETQAEIDARSGRVNELAGRYALESAKARLRQMIGEKLSQRGIKAYAVTINFTTSKQGETLLESVDVTVDIAHKEEERSLIKELEAELGCLVWLYYTGEEGG